MEEEGVTLRRGGTRRMGVIVGKREESVNQEVLQIM